MSAWDWCRCGHPMLLHDADDMDGTDPTCCVEGCDQNGCNGAEQRTRLDAPGMSALTDEEYARLAAQQTEETH